MAVSGAEEQMFKDRHFDRSVILLCVRWYLADSPSLRDLEEMMAERGIFWLKSLGMTKPVSYKRHRFPPQIIAQPPGYISDFP